MTQLVFIHGPGAGGCADSYVGRGRQFWAFTLVRGVVTLWEWVS